MNSINLTGRITRDPELKQKTSGEGSYCYFCVAVDAGKDKDGNKQTDFVDCIAYNKQAEFISKYIVKGSMIELSGRLHITSREDSDGNKVKKATVIVNNVGIISSGKPKDTASDPETDTSTPSKASDTATTDLPFEL